MAAAGAETQRGAALAGGVTDAMRAAAARERCAPEEVRDALVRGTAVLPANPRHRALEPAVVGRDFSCKVNANIGSSPLSYGVEREMEKMRLAIRVGADTVMDLSTGPDLDETRAEIVRESTVPVGTVPIYQALCAAGGDAEALTTDGLLSVIEAHAASGVDFMTIHAGLLRRHLPLTARRTTGIVSRGGAILARWMAATGGENPLYERFDEVCAILRAHDVAFSLGDGLRPGCLADANDEAQFAELDVLGELAARARDAGCQAMVEGPGHVPFDLIAENVERAERVCGGAPFYVLGPLVVDVAAGYDHVASAIGATAAGAAGASLLCYVTPSEHLGLPGLEEVRQGVLAHRIAAHAADVARHRRGARARDDAMARARYALDWEGQFAAALDPERAREIRRASLPSDVASSEPFCSMCGPDLCAVRNDRRMREATAAAVPVRSDRRP